MVARYAAFACGTIASFVVPSCVAAHAVRWWLGVLHSQVGCERYLAPERLDPTLLVRAYGTESDVWSFGKHAFGCLVPTVLVLLLCFPVQFALTISRVFRAVAESCEVLYIADDFVMEKC